MNNLETKLKWEWLQFDESFIKKKDYDLIKQIVNSLQKERRVK